MYYNPSGTGEPTRAKVSYELALRLLGNNEQAKIQLAKDIDAIDYTAKPKYPPDKQGNVPLLNNMRTITWILQY